MSDRVQEVTPGIYRHFEGKLYFVNGVGVNKDTKDCCVVYYPLYTSGEERICVRSVGTFNEDVVEGVHSGPRFTKISDWNMPNIVPGTKFRALCLFYTAEVYTVLEVIEDSERLVVESISGNGRDTRRIPLNQFISGSITFL
ncbi:MAG: DUF1653 domain-containing protein [Nitrospira sp.]